MEEKLNKTIDMLNNMQDYLVENNFFEEFREEFDAFKIVKLVYYMGFTDSEEYYSKAKAELARLDCTSSLVAKKDSDKRKIILDSDNLKECNLALRLYDCERKVKSMQESKSWKVTKPLRKFTSSLK